MITILEKFLTGLERGWGGEVKTITRTASAVKNAAKAHKRLTPLKFVQKAHPPEFWKKIR
jgi:hypothetical protein